ncbi:EscU/YscU/HrcU family type III secretion system export apparatus switch protein [Bacillus massiliigorillae]|uniref:EscU/YscU/HrcU family type III secretion system export apparatus switch protein n=1 Tax=Bacillus massiliigorillae TaxID=1243664 RepID=UPI0003A2A693|nr:EscU/YscU/HrcU family type III secretion system export apparatus switch protein [Bacillus massiliigorillae]
MIERRKEAIALKYDQEKDAAPKVIGKGKGKIAENILEAAKANDIPIQEDPSLTELLGKLNINESIPAELYEAVAEVFAFIYQVDREVGKK